jgi:hypothetical protein
MNALGATAIARVKPNKPTGGLAQFLGELHQLPTLPRLDHLKLRSRRLFRDAGSEYLNIQFGWVPFLKDIKDFIHNVYHLQERVDQIDRDNGRFVKRKITLFDNTTTTLTTNLGAAYGTPVSFTDFYQGTPQQISRETKVTDKAWFSSLFSFYVPPFKGNSWNVQRRIQLARIIFGLELTPRLVWELTPWSWLADWCGNLGDNISNLSDISSDALVMRNAYIMRHTRTEQTYTCPISFVTGQQVAKQTFFTEVKQRNIASPYGFGLKEGDFSTTQLAILGALAASRSKH